MNPTAGRSRDPSRGRERATRILDAAEDLLLRHGARRVTVEDVAVGANIGKGTVYLHWETREKLFAAVFDRAVARAMSELLVAMRTRPSTCLPHQFAHDYFLAVMHRPLLRGLLLADPELLGRLARQHDPAWDERHHLVSERYFRLLAEYGVLRAELGADEVAYAFQATFEGFVRAEGELTRSESAAPPAAAQPAATTLERRADLLARTVELAFEDSRPVTTDDLRSLAADVVDLFTDLVDRRGFADLVDLVDRAELGAPAAS
ncbi:TetR/AcrR family transcriptional regulator [Frankia sp. AiPs1]|uniref:TetR/AcrR family transcriptional regulator n=1 Tax=Frankia sp. AiPs1 TaxID=573493 RepID=UPI0020433AC8|nr:TetR/AcrR family transcriptional regulator [Frankia sp. AiPs1]MCM3922328.1 TetR/AcrR family transcriptional regulator [Frankia sp. AiPs1]